MIADHYKGKTKHGKDCEQNQICLPSGAAQLHQGTWNHKWKGFGVEHLILSPHINNIIGTLGIKLESISKTLKSLQFQLKPPRNKGNTWAFEVIKSCAHRSHKAYCYSYITHYYLLVCTFVHMFSYIAHSVQLLNW